MRWITVVWPLFALAAASSACGRGGAPHDESATASAVVATPTPDTSTAAGRLAAADVGDLGRYWLGAHARDLTLMESASHRIGDYVVLMLTYGVADPNGSPAGGLQPCVYLEESSPHGMDLQFGPRTDVAHLIVLGSEAAVFNWHPPRLWIVQDGAATPTPVPGGSWGFEVRLPDALVRASSLCGDPDPFNSLEGMTGLARALVRFQP